MSAAGLLKAVREYPEAVERGFNASKDAIHAFACYVLGLVFSPLIIAWAVLAFPFWVVDAVRRREKGRKP